jgi:hypothetical protein
MQPPITAVLGLRAMTAWRAELEVTCFGRLNMISVSLASVRTKAVPICNHSLEVSENLPSCISPTWLLTRRPNWPCSRTAPAARDSRINRPDVNVVIYDGHIAGTGRARR